ncbi:MAG: IS21 family transposase, partial [Gammaproteobacteria bacterium]|nr:IS21 family transposase [Gammaproteobacteria bacterium]
RLERLLFPADPTSVAKDRQIPDWVEVNWELKGKGVTLFLLWQEYRSNHPQGYQYSWFCDQYRRWQGKRDLVMRQNHRAGEKLFVDYAGQTVAVVDPGTGEIREAQIFVAVLGASNYTYAEATWTQGLSDWIGSHQRSFQYMGGVPEIVVPDNLRSGVSKAHRYEPDINPTYQEMATHYGVAVIPARVRKPKDKSKAEIGVQVVERWILAALRHCTFFSLVELNSAIRELLERLNARAFKKLPGSRQELFQSLDAPALKPLPTTTYTYAEWKKVRVHIDYHVEVDGHYYSVPYQLVKLQLDARLTAYTMECFHKGKRVASHPRSRNKGRHTTVAEHMPESHRKYGDWSPQRLISWAEKIGASTAQVITSILSSRRHPQQGYRSCLGVLRLGKSYGEQRLEAACQRALLLGTNRYKSIESILKHGLDNKPLPEQQELALSEDHDNIRGPSYYH